MFVVSVKFSYPSREICRETLELTFSSMILLQPLYSQFLLMTYINLQIAAYVIHDRKYKYPRTLAVHLTIISYENIAHFVGMSPPQILIR